MCCHSAGCRTVRLCSGVLSVLCTVKGLFSVLLLLPCLLRPFVQFSVSRLFSSISCIKDCDLSALLVGMENDAATVETAVPPGHMGSHRTQQQVLYTRGSQSMGCCPHNLGRVRTTVTPFLSSHKRAAVWYPWTRLENEPAFVKN